MSRKKPRRLKHFLITLNASQSDALKHFVEDLASKRWVKIVQGSGTSLMIIEIRSTHRSLRKFQKSAPGHIYVAYEEREPHH